MTGLAPLSEAKHRRLRALQSRTMREKYESFLVEGLRSVVEALRSEWDTAFICVTQTGRAHLSSLPATELPCYLASEDEFEEFSTTEHSQGIVAVVHARRNVIADDAPGIIVALDRIADPGNVGSIIRTADWFGAAGVVLSAGCAELFNPKTVRSTMGSLFHIPVMQQNNLAHYVEAQHQRGRAVWCADMGGVPVDGTYRAVAESLLIIGSEAHGLDPALRAASDAVLAVPKKGKAESLNAAAAASALLALLNA